MVYVEATLIWTISQKDISQQQLLVYKYFRVRSTVKEFYFFHLRLGIYCNYTKQCYTEIHSKSKCCCNLLQNNPAVNIHKLFKV